MLVAINGFFGQMGQMVYSEVLKSNDFEFAGGIDKVDKEKSLSKNNYILNSDKSKIFGDIFMIKRCDGVIDFSNPSALNQVLNFCLDRRVPLVLATTGLNESDERKVEFASKYIPIFKSSNLSLAVQVLCELVSTATEKLKNYDIEIVETHHNKKKDAPSGTAIMIANKIAETNKILSLTTETKRPPMENIVGVHSLRGGGVVGEHEVFFLGERDSIKITHTAYSREIFARGALDAMRFLKGKQKGLYSMQDYINER